MHPRSTSRRATLLVLCTLGSSAFASDVLLEAGPAFTTTSADNPRTGSVGVAAQYSQTLTEAWELTFGAQYTRDLATKTAETQAKGSNVFLFDVTAAFAPTEHWLFSLQARGSPPSQQKNATTVTLTDKTADVVVDSNAWSLGGLFIGSWASAGGGAFESTVDVVLGAAEYEVFQQAELPNTARANSLRALCQLNAWKRAAACALVNGTTTPLFQARLGAAYTATFGRRTDVGLEVTSFLYDRDPLSVGYFSVVALGNATFGTGLPVLPLQLAGKASVSHRFEHFTVRAYYQAGLYPDGAGTNHIASVKVTWKYSRAFRLWVTGVGQLDLDPTGALRNPGGAVLAGALVSWD